MRAAVRRGLVLTTAGVGALVCLPTCRGPTATTGGSGPVTGGAGGTIARPSGSGGAFGGSAFPSTTEVAGELPVGPGANSLAAGDFDGDGLVDVAVATGMAGDPAGSSISVLFQDSVGQFGAPTLVATSDDEISALLAGDVNGDGRDDLVWATSTRELAMVSAGRTFAPAIVLPRPADAGPTREAALVYLDEDAPAAAVFLAEASSSSEDRGLFVVSGIAPALTPKLVTLPDTLASAHILNRPSRVLRGNLTPRRQFLFVEADFPLRELWYSGDGAGGLMKQASTTELSVAVAPAAGALELQNSQRSVVILYAASGVLGDYLGGIEGPVCSMPIREALSPGANQAIPTFLGYVPATEPGPAALIAASVVTTAPEYQAITFFGIGASYDYGAACKGAASLAQLAPPLVLDGPIVAQDSVNLGAQPAIVVVHGPAGARHTSLVTLSTRLVGTKPLPAVPPSPQTDGGIDGSVTTGDAGDDSGHDPTDAGDDSPTDATRDRDAAPSADGDSPATQVCEWVTVAMCDTGRSLSTFCGPGRFLVGLERCDGTGTTLPSGTYQSNRLCGCEGGKLGSCCEGVAFQAVNCCYE